MYKSILRMLRTQEIKIHNILNLANRVSKYCVGMEGNISCKKENTFLIKASGAQLQYLTDKDLIECDFEGNQLNNKDKKPSMELGFHKFLLGFDDINYVSHTHPVNTLKILCSTYADTFSKERLFPDQIVCNGEKSCLVPYVTPGNELTEIIKIHVNSFIKTEGYFPKLILLKNHGIITCGDSVKECIVATEICEKSAEIFIGAKGLCVDYLTSMEILMLRNDDKEKYRQQQLK